MVGIFSPLETQPIWVTVLFGIVAYGCVVWGLRSFLKPALVNIFDPMNVQFTLFVGPALLGLLLLPYLTGTYSDSYLVILVFLTIFLLLLRFSGRSRKPNMSDRMGVEFQKSLLTLSILIVVLNVIINMIIPGTIPLFTEGGVYSRFDATQNSRLFYWASLGLSPMPGLIYALTQNGSVRRLAVVAVFIQTVAGLLFANKGAVLTIPFVILNAMFVSKLRNEMVRFRKLKSALMYCLVFVICITPVYLGFIGFGGGGSLLMPLATRFLAGFDQLMLTSQFDLVKGARFGSLLHVNLFEYQLMPFFKAVFSHQYEYSSVGQYVIQAVTGDLIQGAGTLPNSNLILETIFTSGKYLGLLLFGFECGAFYWCRRIALGKPVTPFWLVAMYVTVFQPFGLFMSGQEWATETAVVAMTVSIAVLIASFWRFARNALRLVADASPSQAAELRS